MKNATARALVALLVFASTGSGGPTTEEQHWQKVYDDGNLAREEKRFDEAERLLNAAVKESQSFGKDGWRYGHSLHCLALTYSDQGKYGQAVAIRKEILSNGENARKAPSASDLAGSHLNNLANEYRYWGKFAEAAPLYARALDILEKHPDADPLSFSVVLTNQAKLFRAQGRFAEAEQNLKRALPYQIRWSGGERGYVTWVLDEYVALLQSTGRDAEARALRIRSLAIKVSDHQGYAAEARKLGKVKDAQKYDQRLEQLKAELAELGK